MLIRIKTHPRHRDIVVVETPPGMASTMGAFEAARFVADGGAERAHYVIPADQVENLRRFLRHHGNQILDDRKAADDREKYSTPLPECSRCGLPSTRRAALTLTWCLGCGEPWAPITYDRDADLNEETHALTFVTCDCGLEQRRGFPHCRSCGEKLPPVPPRPASRQIDWRGIFKEVPPE